MSIPKPTHREQLPVRECAAGFCLCGCGEKTKLAPQTRKRDGWIKGEPMKYVLGHNRRKSPVEYLVDEETGCWVWQRVTNSEGYGQKKAEGRMQYAHRLYYEDAHGKIPQGLHVDHLCRNRACVNPDHLEAVTNAENVRRGAGAKLTQRDVEAIRRSGLSQAALADAYEVCQPQISKIKGLKAWLPA